jgi:hypothetical protein
MSSDGKSGARTNLLHVDLKDLKAPWLAWCAAQGLTPSEAVRRVLRETLDMAKGPTAPFPHGVGTGVVEQKRLEIRMSSEQHDAMRIAADAEGMSLPRWLQALVIIRLQKRSQFGRQEVQALTRSSQALLAIGRNINQLIRNQQAGLSGGELSLAQLRFVRELITEHTREVAKLLAANSERWL